VHIFKFGSFDFVDIGQPALAPASDFGDFVIERMNTQVDLIARISVEFELEMAKRNFSVRIDRSIHSETEDIFRWLEGRPDRKFPKERLPLFQGSLETVIGNLLGGGVNLAVVISMEFLIKDSLGVFNIGHIFADAGSDQPVLEPTVGSFNFASGLRGKGMSDVHIAVL
jgi:hypothetical protein